MRCAFATHDVNRAISWSEKIKCKRLVQCDVHCRNHLCDAMYFHCDLRSHCGNPLRCSHIVVHYASITASAMPRSGELRDSNFFLRFEISEKSGCP